MASVNVHEAKTHLSRLLKRVQSGEEIVIARAGRAVARLVPAHAPGPRVLGADAGRWVVPADFNAPLPDEILAAFGPAPERSPRRRGRSTRPPKKRAARRR